MSGQGSQAARKTLVAELFAGAHQPGAGVPAHAARRRAAAGRARRRDDRGDRQGVGRPVRRGPAGADAARLAARGRRGRAGRRGRGAAGFRLEVGRPVSPMLAQSAADVAAALEKIGGPAALEWKLDGVRVQAHRSGARSRCSPAPSTTSPPRCPSWWRPSRALPDDDLVLDGEVIALRPDGRPEPFQVTSGRVGEPHRRGRLRETVPLSVFFFDALRVGGADLLDLPDAERHAALAGGRPGRAADPRGWSPTDPDGGRGVLHRRDQARPRGRGGQVPADPLRRRRRGAGLDQGQAPAHARPGGAGRRVGHGRREGKLSNLHLGARDPETGGFVMLGKTFKGLTDELLAWQTERFLGWPRAPPTAGRSHVRPELVVEIAFDGVQRSPRYPGGMALRFARVLRYRPDKRGAGRHRGWSARSCSDQ